MSTRIYRTLFICLMITLTSQVFSQTSTASASAQSTLDVSLKVKGITCAKDLNTIATNVAKIKGVSSCTPGKKGATSTFSVRYNPSVVTETEIVEVIEDTPGCKNPKDRPYKVKM